MQWKLVGNPVMIAPRALPEHPRHPSLAGLAHAASAPPVDPVTGVPYNVDQWDGYPAERARVLGHLRDRGIRDAVFLTGDIHSGWAAELPADALTYPVNGDSVGVELVCTSVTSDNLDDILERAAAHGVAGRRDGDQGEQPAHEVPGLRLARLLGAGGDPGGRADGLVHPRRPHRSELGRGLVDVLAGAGREPEGRAGVGAPGVTRGASTGGSSCAPRPPVARPSSCRRRSGRRPPGPPAALRVYVLVVDGCRPDEITPMLTPRLHALKSAGTWFAAARSLPVMETIPNHVMMMTGVRPDRSGVPANSVYDRAEGVVRDLDRPTDLRFPTLLERLRDTGRTTGSVLSKQYLFGIFGTRATYRWEPFPIVPVSGHAPDAATMDALLAMVDGPDPDLVFANLGDIDRVGHSDLSGTSLRAARTAALASTDLQVGRFVDHLQGAGRWESSVVLVLADHSMDWSVPDQPDQRRQHPRPAAGPAGVGRRSPRTAARTSCTGPARRPCAPPGWPRCAGWSPRTPASCPCTTPRSCGSAPEAGDLVAYCRAGWRFTDPTPLSNPIPGNHGHPATEPIPFLVSGGHPAVRRGAVSGAPARTVDVAPTVGALFGLGPPSGGYDGTIRAEALRSVPMR